MATDWADIIVAKFMNPDEYEDISFPEWHGAMYNLLNPQKLWKFLYKDVPEEEREEHHSFERRYFIIEEYKKYATYQIERIEGEFAKLCDDSGKICKLKKY